MCVCVFHEQSKVAFLRNFFIILVKLLPEATAVDLRSTHLGFFSLLNDVSSDDFFLLDFDRGGRVGGGPFGSEPSRFNGRFVGRLSGGLDDALDDLELLVEENGDDGWSIGVVDCPSDSES